MMHDRLKANLRDLESRGRLRSLRSRSGIDFTSNDYLGFAESDELNRAAADAIARGVPVGSGGSRLLRGNHPEHEALEVVHEQLAALRADAVPVALVGPLEGEADAAVPLGLAARIAGVDFLPDAPDGEPTHWLTVITLDDPTTVRRHLESLDIEARPAWKPMHLQPVFAGCEVRGGAVAEEIFRRGLCLPSGSSMTDADVRRVVDAVRTVVSSPG